MSRFVPLPLYGGKKLQGKGDKNMNMKKDLLIVSCLRQDARMKLTDMTKLTKIPVSTLFDNIKAYEGGLIKKNTAIISFEKLGYQAKALILFSTGNGNKEKLFQLLNKSKNINSLYKINNGWSFMAETIFPGVKEVEEFMEGVEGQVKLKDKKIFYIIDEIKKEEFLANPQVTKLEGGVR